MENVQTPIVRPKTCGTLIALLLTLAASAARADGPPPIFVGGRLVHQPAFMEGSHVLVPVRGVFEALHATVAYTPPRIVVVRKDGAVIAGLVVDRRHAIVNNEPRMLSVAPVRHGGRIYVPLRAIAEIAGANVAYSRNPRLIDIRLPNGELTARPVADQEPPAPLETAPPVWALGTVGAVVFAFALECLRRLVLLVGAKRTRAPR